MTKKAKRASSGQQSSFIWESFFYQPAGFAFLCLGLFVLVIAVYWPALKGQYLFADEFGPLVNNSHVNHGFSWEGILWSFKPDYVLWMPVTWWSHMLDFEFFGTDPWGHHLTNLLLHGANAVLLLVLLRRMTGAMWRCLIVAVLFAFHPLRVESVAWITERKDTLSYFFGFIALWSYAEYAARAKSGSGKLRLFYGLTFAFYCISLLSKQTLVTFPCLLWLLDYWPLNRWQRGKVVRLIVEKLPFFIPVPIVTHFAYVANLEGGALYPMWYQPLEARIETVLVSYVKYLGNIFFPSDLCVYYLHPGYWPGKTVMLSTLLIVSLSVAAWFLRRKAPYFFVGWFWYLGVFTPVVGFVILYLQTNPDRFSYVPCIGINIIIVWGLHAILTHWRHLKMATFISCSLVTGVLMLATRHQIGFWMDNETVWSHAIAVDPNNYVAHTVRAICIGPTSPDEALREYQTSAKINLTYVEGDVDLANILVQLGHFEEANIYFRAAWKSFPWNYPGTKDSRILSGWAMSCYRLGNVDEAIIHLQEGLTHDPKCLQYMIPLVSMLCQKERFAEAEPVVEKVCAASPKDPNAFNTLGIVLTKTGKLDGAISAFQQALQFAPDATILKNNLAAAINAKQQAAIGTNSPAAISSNPPPAH